jgi:hypothetical protein
MEVISVFETLVTTYRGTWCHNSDETIKNLGLALYFSLRVTIYSRDGQTFLWAGQMKKVKCQVGQLTFLLAILVNNNKPETQTRAARIAKQ